VHVFFARVQHAAHDLRARDRRLGAPRLETLAGVAVEARGVGAQDQRAEDLLEARVLRVVELAPAGAERALRHRREVVGLVHHGLEPLAPPVDAEGLRVLHHVEQGRVEAVDHGRRRRSGLGASGKRKHGEYEACSDASFAV